MEAQLAHDRSIGEDRQAGPAEPDLHGLTARHWSLLMLLAEHGGLTTSQVTTLAFGSRPAASRHLGALWRAGLVSRAVVDNDPAHLAHYEITLAGVAVLERRLREAGRSVPLGLGRRWHSDQGEVNEFFVRLVAHARTSGEGHLDRWRHRLDTAVWLHGHGVSDVHALGYGRWIEGDTAIGFLLHIDHHEPSLLTTTAPPSPVVLLSHYPPDGAALPVHAALVIAATDGREQQLHRDLAGAAVGLTVAATTRDRLRHAPHPAAAIWTTGTDGRLLRLIGLARHHFIEPSTKEQ